MSRGDGKIKKDLDLFFLFFESGRIIYQSVINNKIKPKLEFYLVF